MQMHLLNNAVLLRVYVFNYLLMFITEAKHFIDIYSHIFVSASEQVVSA